MCSPARSSKKNSGLFTSKPKKSCQLREQDVEINFLRRPLLTPTQLLAQYQGFSLFSWLSQTKLCPRALKRVKAQYDDSMERGRQPRQLLIGDSLIMKVTRKLRSWLVASWDLILPYRAHLSARKNWKGRKHLITRWTSRVTCYLGLHDLSRTFLRVRDKLKTA
jgi:hypothetical protein